MAAEKKPYLIRKRNNYVERRSTGVAMGRVRNEVYWPHDRRGWEWECFRCEVHDAGHRTRESAALALSVHHLRHETEEE